MQQRISCKSKTVSALRARQRSWSCFFRRSYSSWIFFLCSLSSLFHGHRSRHCKGPHETLRILARWSLIQDSTRLCMDSIGVRNTGGLIRGSKNEGEAMESVLCSKIRVIGNGNLCVWLEKHMPQRVSSVYPSSRFVSSALWLNKTKPECQIELEFFVYQFVCIYLNELKF